ncbi:hypothetical protein JSQ81_07705 [Sporosarcina sp. Marseille-Q4063]|uniref:hypothetical protein n=1 Tax=Sporosarcina sp. Marseille-Q4063 TaxID=2810514 RepID=UPI001BB0B9D7|nr:hypothetical protein [Sporosarcina sp. Marseille-Q4063]QUW23398.1 hypothetical protein JSQ81_07705 [Sporosarcina sp. Marseille-Q4063]
MESERNMLFEQLKSLEEMKVYLMSQINRIGGNDAAIKMTSVYPMAKVKPMIINGYPVFQFSYEGALPLYKESDRDYLAMIRHYYFRATHDSYDFSKVDYQFDKSVIIIAQHFENKIIRDLDNRNRKLIQDAIRHTGLIGDDSWWRVWNFDIGFLDPRGNHVQVFVVSQDSFGDFMTYLKEKYFHLAKIPKATLKEEIFEEYRARVKREKKEKVSKEKERLKSLSNTKSEKFWG